MLKLIAVALCTAATLLVVVAIPRPLHRNVREEFEDSCTLDEESLGTVYEHDDDLEDVLPMVSCNAWSHTTDSGLFRVSPTGGCEFKVYCDMCLVGGEGWIVIQRRRNGDVAFQNKNWTNYRTGFGDYLGEYWMGLQKIHELTRLGTYELFVGFQTGGVLSTARYWAVYNSFSVGSEVTNYKLTLSPMNEGRSCMNNFDHLRQMHEGQSFTTYDRDHDGVDQVNCANHTGRQFGGWWFGGDNTHNTDIRKCIDSNLNGRYYETGSDGGNGNGIKWKGVDPYTASFLKTIMAIRRVS
jgi:hypothetical protein